MAEIVSNQQDILRQAGEIGAHYAMVPDDLVRSGEASALTVYAALDRIGRGDKSTVTTAVSYLAEYTGLSKRTIQRALKLLSGEGYIVIDRPEPGRGMNRYTLPFRESRKDSATTDIRQIDTPSQKYPRQVPKVSTTGAKSIHDRCQNGQQTNSTQESYQEEPIDNNHIQGHQIKLDETEGETQPVLDPDILPVWYSTAYRVPGWTVLFADADKWRREAGISEDLAERTSYGLVDSFSDKKKYGARKPYATWQNWCRRDRDKANRSSPYKLPSTDQLKNAWGKNG